MPLLPVISRNLCLLLGGRRLEVLVGSESEGATDQDNGVEADAHVGLLGAAGAGLGGGLLGFGGRVVGLDGESGVSYANWFGILKWCGLGFRDMYAFAFLPQSHKCLSCADRAG